MKVNRVISVDYSNSNNKQRVLGSRPSFGDTNQAIMDYVANTRKIAQISETDMVNSGFWSAFKAKCGDFANNIANIIFTPKNTKQANNFKNSLDILYDPAYVAYKY